MNTSKYLRISLLTAGLLGATSAVAATEQPLTVTAQVVSIAEILAPLTTFDFGPIAPNDQNDHEVSIPLCLYTNTGTLLMSVKSGNWDNGIDNDGDANTGTLMDYSTGNMLTYKIGIKNMADSFVHPMPVDGSGGTAYNISLDTVAEVPCSTNPDYSRASALFTLVSSQSGPNLVVGTYQDNVIITISAG